MSLSLHQFLHPSAQLALQNAPWSSSGPLAFSVWPVAYLLPASPGLKMAALWTPLKSTWRYSITHVKSTYWPFSIARISQYPIYISFHCIWHYCVSVYPSMFYPSSNFIHLCFIQRFSSDCPQLESGGKTLHITQARLEDAGKYTCVATNAAGEAQQHIRLSVHGKPHRLRNKSS